MQERALFSCKPARHELKTVGFHQVFFLLYPVSRSSSFKLLYYQSSFFFLCLLRLVYTRYTQHSQLFPIEEEIRTAAEDQKYIKNIILENVRLLYIYICKNDCPAHGRTDGEFSFFLFWEQSGTIQLDDQRWLPLCFQVQFLTKRMIVGIY